jgi:hypothetical protein
MRVSLLRRSWAWLSRLHHCRGFGIQSPTDYAFVRYVVNEHWPYYAYETLTEDDWLTRRLGRLYLRLANWRQPTEMVTDRYQQWWHAGCRRTRFVEHTEHVELARVDVTDRQLWTSLFERCDTQSVLIVEDIYKDRKAWNDIVSDQRVGTTFDLYYCGIIFFDTQRYSHHYIINF